MTDNDLLNFALNLEYLEAAFYSRAVAGQAVGDAVGGNQVTFADPLIAAFAQSVMQDEVAHVSFLKQTLGSDAIAPPPIDFRAGFATLARAARLPFPFDPFADQLGFLLGAFVFEDVGVTAYHGAVPYLVSRKILTAAAGIHATEAYHAGMVRSLLYRMGGRAVAAAVAISAVRERLGGSGTEAPVMTASGAPDIIPASVDGIGPSRTPQQVLAILFADDRAGTHAGGFFPHGVNGTVTTV